jgi:hypothetical protein
MPPKPCKSDIRNDGCLMVEISPSVYGEESIAERLGLWHPVK